jgi:ankyrin repeat protein
MTKITKVAIVSAFGICHLTLTTARATPQRANEIDFVRDVQPIFAKYCYDCHGPEKQMNGFRLDRRADARRGGTGVVIAGTATSSRLYLRLIGSNYGRQMPVEGDRPRPEEIDTIRRWIDQGAEWPDSASGDPPVLPLDPATVRAFSALREGNRQAFLAALPADTRISTVRGPGGATPLMIAALYGDTALMKGILDAGGDPNVTNDAGATALHWSVGDLEKVKLLIARGADVDVRSRDGRTPLLAAAAIRGNVAVVTRLLDKGANPSAFSAAAYGPVTAVTEAAKQGDEAMVRLLIARGADVAKTGVPALAFAIRSQCDGCVEAIAAKLPPPLLSAAMTLAAPPLGRAAATPALLARGADPRAKNPAGFPILLLASGSSAMPVDAVKALIARGADVNATGPNGETALDLARRHGDNPVTAVLLAAGAHATPATAHSTALTPAPFAPASSARAAIQRSLPLLQRADVEFMRKTGCVSCHNNTQAAETVALAQRGGFHVDAAIASAQLARIAAYAGEWRERNLQGVGIAGDAGTMSAILSGLAAQHYPADLTTDAMARFLRTQQRADGSWLPFSSRPPLEANQIKVTVETIRALKAYAAPTDRRLAEDAIARAAAWIRQLQPDAVQDRVYHLVALHDIGADGPTVAAAAARVAAVQRADGGWAQLPGMSSDAYATGEALVALLETEAMRPRDPAVRRGLDYLLRTQLADGSWFVARRAVPLQPYTDAGFPHGRDQFISASATHFATQALLLSLR